MNILIGFLACVFVLFGFPSLGVATESHFDASPLDVKPRAADLDYHFAAMSHYEQETKPLEQKIKSLMKRVQLYDQKPYLDSKGLRRNGLKLRLGNLMKELSELRQNIALHQELANQILEAKEMSENNPAERSSVPD